LTCHVQLVGSQDSFGLFTCYWFTCILNLLSVGLSSVHYLSGMDGPPPPEEDFTSIPIAERLAHKNWKARVNAYESLIKTFQNTASDTDPAFKPYINNPDLLKKIATDANAVAQEKGVECLVALVKFAGETSARTREAVVPALVDKCLGSARAGTKTQSLELILQYAEVENSAAGVVVCRPSLSLNTRL